MNTQTFKIGNKTLGLNHPTYFIADIASNHDGDLEKAKELIYLCAEAGADAAKFQHFSAKTLVSDVGFKSLGSSKSHQANWGKSVYDVYDEATLNKDWTPILKDTCDKAGIHFFSSPYSFELVDYIDQYVPAYKIGSGDITWPGIIEKMANKKKPLFLATGASTFDEVVMAVDEILKHNTQLCLMQCNTNYTASLENFKHIQLNVLKSYANMFPGLILGLSDHTLGHATALGAIALGARAIEKHFTDDNSKKGPDHKFAMNPKTWREMVDRSRELELSLGTGIKKVEENEKDTVIVQRRSLRAKIDLKPGDTLSAENLEALRPCPTDALPPYQMKNIVGKKLSKAVIAGDIIRWSDIG